MKGRKIRCKRLREPNHINADPDADTKLDRRKTVKKEKLYYHDGETEVM